MTVLTKYNNTISIITKIPLGILSLNLSIKGNLPIKELKEFFLIKLKILIFSLNLPNKITK